MSPVFFDGILSFTSFFLIVLGITFLLKRYANSSNLFLGWVLFILGVSIFGRFLEGSGLILKVPHLIEIDFPFCFLLPPLYLFFCNALLFKKTPTSKEWLIHSLPAIFAFLFLLPVFVMGTSEKINYIKTETVSSFSWRYMILNPVFFMLSVGYFSYVLWILRKGAVNKKDLNTAKVKWMRWFTIVFLVIKFCSVLFIFLIDGEKKFIYSPILAILAIIALIIWLSDGSDLTSEKQAPQLISIHEEVEEKYKDSTLSEEDVNRIAIDIDHITKTKQLFLDKKLNIKTLSEEIKINSRTTSEVINRYYKKSFTDFINEHRVNYCKDILLQKNQILTLDSIGEEAGFNSRASFYANFKKNTGLSPAEYIKSLK